MAMSLPVQLAIHNAVHTSAAAVANNSSDSNSKAECVEEVCAACGQIIQNTDGSSTFGEAILLFFIMLILVLGTYKLVDWIMRH